MPVLACADSHKKHTFWNEGRAVEEEAFCACVRTLLPGRAASGWRAIAVRAQTGETQSVLQRSRMR